MHIGLVNVDTITSDSNGGFVRYSMGPARCVEHFSFESAKIKAIDVFWGFKVQKAKEMAE